MNLSQYWQDTLRQDADAMRRYFRPDARIRWHNSNECFTAEEFLRANCEYPGNWDGEIQRVEQLGMLYITVVHVRNRENEQSFHVTSFLQTDGEKITAIDEYWGNDGPAPKWRIEKQLGMTIIPA